MWLALAGIVLLAVAVRFAGATSRLSIDDAYSWFAASSPNAHVFLQRLADNENTPPLIYLLIMVMPGSAPVWLRLPAVVPGVLMCLALYFALRPRLGNRTALLAALGVAVAPYLVTYSNLARGFMLADLALLIAFWCVLSLAERETRAKWVVFVLAGTVAVYTEYASAIFIVALVVAAWLVGVPNRRQIAIAGGLVLVTVCAWIPEIIRAQKQVGVTKLDPLSATASLSGLRDVFVTLALGENGGTASTLGHSLLFAVMLGVCAVGYLVMRRDWDERSPGARRTIALLAATGALTLIGYALAALVGIDVFTQRYLTILVPVGAALAASVLTSFESRRVGVVAAVCLVALGLGNFARRLGGQWQPDFAPVAAIARVVHPRSVLTNTPAALYYLSAYRPIFDRPYNLGPGLAQTCRRPCLIVDDPGLPGGTPRRVFGTSQLVGRLVVTEQP